MRITKRGSVYRARIRDAVGKEHCRHFDTRRAAVAWESEQLTAKAKGQSLDLGDRTTVGEYARRWATGRPFRASTARNVEGLIKNHIEATPLGSRRLNAVRPSEVQTWATDRSKLMSPGRLKILVGYLRSIYRDAVLDRVVATSPVVRIAMPSIERERVIPLTVGEVMALADAMPDRNRAMVIVQATCGLRISELVALRLEDINFLKRTVRVEYQFETHTKRRVEPKTPRSRRTLPLPTFTAEVLAAHLAKYPPAVDGSLFSTYLGTPYRIDIYSTHFKAAVKKADLT